MRASRRSRLGMLVCLPVVAIAIGAASTIAIVLGASRSAAAPGQYVALGDSYASGTGTGQYPQADDCRRSALAYPSLLAAERPDAAFVFAACSGATTADVLDHQVGALSRATTHVTISIGGNDLGFGDLISTCVRSDCVAELAATRAAVTDVLTDRLDTVYRAVRERVAPKARVVVVGYPRLFSGSYCLGTVGVSAAERAQANLLSDEIDRVVAARAAARGFTYVSTLTPFGGHAICSSAAWVNGLNVREPRESFHPTRRGHREGYLPLVRAALS